MAKNDIAKQLEQNRQKPKRGKLLDKLPESEKQWSELDSVDQLSAEHNLTAPISDDRKAALSEDLARHLKQTAQPTAAAQKSATFKMTINIFPEVYDQFEEMMSAGKRIGKNSVGLTLQHNELFAVMCNEFYQKVYNADASQFERFCTEILAERRKREGK